MATINVPVSEVDPFADDVLGDPYDTYRELRDLGSVVRLDRWNLWALMRYEPARQALLDWETYSSLAIGLNPAFNDFAAPDVDTNVIMAPPPQHTKLRAILGGDLAPAAYARSSSRSSRSARRRLSRSSSSAAASTPSTTSRGRSSSI